MSTPTENYKRIANEISEAAVKLGRRPESFTLVAVSKTKPVTMIEELLQAGHVVFGENYVQEAAAKREHLGDRPILHLIGHLQRNKAKQAVKIFDVIQSIDSLALAQEVAKEAVKLGKLMPVLVQVNVSDEESKAGVNADKVVELCAAILRLEGIHLSGLMSIGSFVPETAPDEQRRAEFKLMAQLLGEVNDRLGIGLQELSMGMSHDYMLAIEEGATVVRIGSRIFGERE